MATVKTTTRRTALKLGLAGGAVLASPYVWRPASAEAACGKPTGPVKLGFNVPQSGAYQHEGADQLRGCKLAVKHLNGLGDGGMLKTMQPCDLKGRGILGQSVEFITGDSATDPKIARESAGKMIADGVSMITGGSSSAEAVAVQSLCHDAGVIFMAGLTHANDTTGKDRRRYGFRHFFNAHQSGLALGPVVANAYGRNRVAYHLTADYNWGWTQEKSIRQATEQQGWTTAKTVLTPLGAKDYSEYLVSVLASDADVLVLNHYGLDMTVSLGQAVQLGLRDRQVNGRQMEIVVPLYSRLMAAQVGDAVKGVYGTKNWHWSLTDAGSIAFATSFAAEYGFPPSQAAHTCYAQILLYAQACEMAGTTAPAGVIKALEGFRFDGLGNGPTEYRAEDHQCIKRVLVVQGNPEPKGQFDILSVVEEVPVEQVTYPVDLFPGTLGDIKVPC